MTTITRLPTPTAPPTSRGTSSPSSTATATPASTRCSTRPSGSPTRSRSYRGHDRRARRRGPRRRSCTSSGGSASSSAGPARTPACGSRSTPATPEHGALLAAHRGALDRDRHRAPLLRARVGGAPRRARRAAARRRRASRSAATTSRRRAATARTCSPSPRSGSSPTSPSRAGARGPPVQRAHARRSRSSSTARTVSLEEGLSRLTDPDRERRRPSAEAVTAGARARAAHPGVRVQHAARRQVDRRPPAQLRRLAREPNLDNEASDESVQALVDAVVAPLRHPAALVRAEGAAPRDRPARRLRPHGVGRRRRARVRLDAARGSSCSTRTGRSRPSSPTSSSASSTSRGSTRPCGRASAPARSARTRCRRSTRTCCSTGRRAGATCSRSPTSSATACTPTSRAGQGIFHQSTPLTLAETASVFGETVTFGRLLEATPDPGERARAAGREPRGSDRDRVPPDRDEPVRGRRAHRAARAGRAQRRALRRAVGRDPDRDARRRGRDHRGLPHLVVVHPALHRDARLRLRLRVRAAARAVGVPQLRGARRRPSCRSTSSCCAAAARTPPRSSAGSSASTSPTPGSGTAASTSSRSSSTRPRPRHVPRAGWSPARRGRSQAGHRRERAQLAGDVRAHRCVQELGDTVGLERVDPGAHLLGGAGVGEVREQVARACQQRAVVLADGHHVLGVHGEVTDVRGDLLELGPPRRAPRAARRPRSDRCRTSRGTRPSVRRPRRRGPAPRTASRPRRAPCRTRARNTTRTLRALRR